MGVVAITGASGGIGSRVATRLADRGMAPRLIVRDPKRAPAAAGAQVAVVDGYHDRVGMTAALRGATTLMMISAREAPDRVAQHNNVVDAAVDAGVERIVYTSFLGAAADATFTFARQHHATEQHIRASGLAFTFLRDSLYLELVPLFTSGAGVIAGPAGNGRIAWVARDDVADVAAAVLCEAGHEGRTYDVTGPEARDLAYAAEQLSAFSGARVTYHAQSMEEAYASRSSLGAPKFEVDGWITSYACIATGEMDVVSDTVPRLTGHPAQTLREYLGANPDSYAHLGRHAHQP
jgi:NAD(P)H dehydrogenase (quinone)